MGDHVRGGAADDEGYFQYTPYEPHSGPRHGVSDDSAVPAPAAGAQYPDAAGAQYPEAHYPDAQHPEAYGHDAPSAAHYHDPEYHDPSYQDPFADDPPSRWGGPDDNPSNEDLYETVVLPRVGPPKTHRAAKRAKAPIILSLAAILVLLGGGAFVVKREFFSGPGLPPDYEAGSAGPVAIVEVHPGDTATEIAEAMLASDVVLSSGAFYNAAVLSQEILGVQPGFYALSTKIPGDEAVAALVEPETRVGSLVVGEGRQLHDTSDVATGSTKRGIFTLISEASCVREVCLSVQEIEQAAAGDAAALGVPQWAMEGVAAVPDRSRQLEGLIAAGSWDFNPTETPTEILRDLVTASAAAYEQTGIATAGGSVNMKPYQVLVAASMIEREGRRDDYAKIARVIVNRLAIGQALEFDSTVNYALDSTELATTDDARAAVTPWNTYASPGLPATPIASPSIEALTAAENPEAGEWIYFVTVDDQGTTLFAKDYEEHLANTEIALQNGILDSAREGQEGGG
jgi:UPF0755 protein